MYSAKTALAMLTEYSFSYHVSYHFSYYSVIRNDVTNRIGEDRGNVCIGQAEAGLGGGEGGGDAPFGDRIRLGEPRRKRCGASPFTMS